MDWLDDDDDSAAARTPVTVAAVARRWPVWAVCALSGAGLIAAAVAVFTTYWVSVAAWLLLMIGGCGLLFYRRIDAISATRHAGGIGAASLQTIEKVAVGVLVLACFVNGLVIAWEIAAWPLWAEWLGTE